MTPRSMTVPGLGLPPRSASLAEVGKNRAPMRLVHATIVSFGRYGCCVSNRRKASLIFGISSWMTNCRCPCEAGQSCHSSLADLVQRTHLRYTVTENDNSRGQPFVLLLERLKPFLHHTRDVSDQLEYSQYRWRCQRAEHRTDHFSRLLNAETRGKLALVDIYARYDSSN